MAVDDFSALDLEIDHYLALFGANAVRSRLIVRDKRNIGIIHPELDDLVTKHRVLTEAQATLLRSRIVSTTIPISYGIPDVLSTTGSPRKNCRADAQSTLARKFSTNKFGPHRISLLPFSFLSIYSLHFDVNPLGLHIVAC